MLFVFVSLYSPFVLSLSFLTVSFLVLLFVALLFLALSVSSGVMSQRVLQIDVVVEPGRDLKLKHTI